MLQSKLVQKTWPLFSGSDGDICGGNGIVKLASRVSPVEIGVVLGVVLVVVAKNSGEWGD